MKVLAILGGVGLLVLGIFLLGSFTTIDSGERGVVIRYGKVTEVLENGFHVVNPFTTDIVVMDTKVQKQVIEANAASKDLQQVTANIAINYRLDPSKVSDIYQSIRKDYESRWIQPKLQDSIKAATAQYTAEELITKREAVREAIKVNLTDRLNGLGILIDDVSVTNFEFSSGFNQSIEAKVKAEQDAKAAQNKLVQVEAEAKQQVAKAQAEAESIRLQSAAANNDKYVELKRLEVQLEFAKKWNGTLPTSVYGNAPIPFLDVK